MALKGKTMSVVSFDKALDCLGYSYIYIKRIDKLELWLRWTKVLGILIPVLVGSILLAYVRNQIILEWAVTITTPLVIGQLLLSTYLTIVGSDTKVMDYSRLASEFTLLHSDFDDFARQEIQDEKRYSILIERYRGLSVMKYSIKDKELRMAMRYGLREYRRACASCKQVPTSMVPTECDVCGNF